MKLGENHQPVDPLFGVGSVLGSGAACASLGIPKIDHHDLRHQFATTWIEGGVDIATVSVWLGHTCPGMCAGAWGAPTPAFAWPS